MRRALCACGCAGAYQCEIPAGSGALPAAQGQPADARSPFLTNSAAGAPRCDDPHGDGDAYRDLGHKPEAIESLQALHRARSGSILLTTRGRLHQDLSKPPDHAGSGSAGSSINPALARAQNTLPGGTTGQPSRPGQPARRPSVAPRRRYPPFRLVLQSTCRTACRARSAPSILSVTPFSKNRSVRGSSIESRGTPTRGPGWRRSFGA